MKEKSFQWLKPGHFYKSAAGDVWCCYSLRPDAPTQAQARCIRVEGSGEGEYFYADGRYDVYGARNHSLVEEVEAFHAIVRNSY